MTLDEIVNQVVFKNKRPDAYSSDPIASKNLIQALKKRGVKIDCVIHPNYFFCIMEKGNIEVCSDSRSNYKPKNMKEAIALAAIKIYSGKKGQDFWEKVFLSLRSKEDLEQLKQKLNYK